MELVWGFHGDDAGCFPPSLPALGHAELVDPAHQHSPGLHWLDPCESALASAGIGTQHPSRCQFAQVAFGINGRHASHASGGDRLTIDLISTVPSDENSFGGRTTPFFRKDITRLVHG